MRPADFIALAEAGSELRTRDRRVVSVIAIDPAAGVIRGSVALEGELVWRRDGSFAAAPAGIAGPLDLVVAPETAATKRASLQQALNEGNAKDRAPFCCD